MTPFMTAFDWDATLRLVAAAVCGMLIGFNRDLKNKPTGMRTLGLVSLGACLAALSALHYDMLRTQPDAMSRVVQGVLQGVLTGVGFIGAGVILKEPGDRRVRGLTTAAAVWVTATLGIACAFASWPIMAVGLVLTLCVLILPRRIAMRFGKDFSETDDD